MRAIYADTLKDCFPCPAEEFEMKGQQTLWDAREIRETIDLMPTADAVEVVRCRDCAHWNSVKKESEFGLCDAWVTLFICTGSDEYCKRGKKKEA